MSDWFPATKIDMGSWEYFSVKMKFGDFFDPHDERKDLISFAQDLDKPDLLDDWYQRKLNEGRAKKDIANYLVSREDAFFSSVVIACLGDIPEWTPLLPSEEKCKELGIKPEDRDEDHGYIRFNKNQKYFVLDGQHRLFAINHILKDPELYAQAGDEIFLDQGINVILVTRGDSEDRSKFKQKYRRLFTSLNRYAKSTNKETNIIMDEDDIYAILSRKLIRELPLFSYDGAPETNPHINIDTKSLKKGSSYFTSLATFYDVNTKLIQTQANINAIPGIDEKIYMQNRPDEDLMEEVYENLRKIWDAIIALFPQFTDIEYRTNSRDPNAPLDSENHDNLLLRPVGQISLFAELARKLIDKADDENYEEILRPLSTIDWDLRKIPFRHLLLVMKNPEDENPSWVISEGSSSHSNRLKAALGCLLYLLDDEGKFTRTRLSRLKQEVLPHLDNLGQAEKMEWWEDFLSLKAE